jgi:hypothetical protein
MTTYQTVQLTQHTHHRLREEVLKLVAQVLDSLMEERGLFLDGRREAVVQQAATHLLDGDAAGDGLAIDVAQVILGRARDPHNGDYLLDLLLLHRLNAGLESELPWHVAQAIVGLARMVG